MGRLLIGDVLERMNDIPDESVDCVVTSPPYWGLRDYDNDMQWGSEHHWMTYLEKLDALMTEIRKVLKPAGTVWINLGDTYSKGPCPARKSRIGIPWRFYTRCIDDGWIARNDIIWHKPNAMPSSVTDRLTNTYEPVLFFAKDEKYYFNLDAVKVPCIYPLNTTTGNAGPKKWSQIPGQRINGFNRNRVAGKADWIPKQDRVPGKNANTYRGFNARYVPAPDKNPGDILRITTKPYAEAHFATFPPELPEFCIKAGCPKSGVVLDPFLGSGTTATVAERLGRDWMGIELNPEYEPMIRRRIAGK